MTVKLLLHTILFGLITVLGFFIAIPIAVTTARFNGFCLLYGKGIWASDGASTYFQTTLTTHNNAAVCDFSVYYHVTVNIVLAAVMTAGYLYLFVSSVKGRTRVVPKWLNTASVILNCICLAITLISACIIATGFNSWCSQLVEGFPNDCASTQKVVDWKRLKIKGSTFHMCYLMAIICCWMTVFLWGIIVGIGVFPSVRRWHARRQARGAPPTRTSHTSIKAQAKPTANGADKSTPIAAHPATHDKQPPQNDKPPVTAHPASHDTQPPHETRSASRDPHDAHPAPDVKSVSKTVSKRTSKDKHSSHDIQPAPIVAENVHPAPAPPTRKSNKKHGSKKKASKNPFEEEPDAPTGQDQSGNNRY